MRLYSSEESKVLRFPQPTSIESLAEDIFFMHFPLAKPNILDDDRNEEETLKGEWSE
jgi:hypothetical protein